MRRACTPSVPIDPGCCLVLRQPKPVNRCESKLGLLTRPGIELGRAGEYCTNQPRRAIVSRRRVKNGTADRIEQAQRGSARDRGRPTAQHHSRFASIVPERRCQKEWCGVSGAACWGDATTSHARRAYVSTNAQCRECSYGASSIEKFATLVKARRGGPATGRRIYTGEREAVATQNSRDVRALGTVDDDQMSGRPRQLP